MVKNAQAKLLGHGNNQFLTHSSKPDFLIPMKSIGSFYGSRKIIKSLCIDE